MSPSTIMTLYDHYLLNKDPNRENNEPFNITRIKSGGISNLAVNQPIGKGGYGEVRAAKAPFTGSPWAVKFVPQQLGEPLTKYSIALIKESKILLGPLKNAPHTIQLRGVYRSSQKVEIVMKRLQGPDLAAHIDQDRPFFTYEIWQNIARQALEALQYYREKHIVHADVKPANCFYNRDTHKFTFIDFGLAFCPDEDQGPRGFTLSSMAPEVLKKYRPSYGIDMWALGIMLFKIYTGYSLFFSGAADNDNRPMTKTDLLALMGEQFPDACPEYLGTLTLEKRYQQSRDEIRQLYSTNALQQAGKKLVPLFAKKIDPWYREPWQARIRQSADWKNESEHAEHIIGLLEKMFIFDDGMRLTPENGLRELPEPKQERLLFSASRKDPLNPGAGFRSYSPILELMQELNLQDASAKFLRLRVRAEV